MNTKIKLSKAMALFRTSKIDKIKTVDITPSELSVLTLIRNSDETISAADISRYLGFSKPYSTKVIKRLISLDYVETSLSTKDHRVNILKVTPKGEELVLSHFEKYQETTDYLYNKLGEQKALKFIALLEEATKLINDYNKAKD